jgi:hypothetical protein
MSSSRIGLVAALLLLLSSTMLPADTLELADGTLLEGNYVGGNKSSVMFDAGGEISVYELSEVVAVYFSAGAAAAQAQGEAPAAQAITVPPGTRLMIRTSDTLDSRQHQAGHRFRAQLEGNLEVGGQLVAPRGATVYGHIAQAKQSGRVAGSSELVVEFTDIMIGDNLHPITTTGLKAETGNTAGTTARRTARGAAIGGLVGGSSGARTGAAVGAGVSIVTSGDSINIPAGTLVETSLRDPLVIQ